MGEDHLGFFESTKLVRVARHARSFDKRRRRIIERKYRRHGIGLQ
jgi:hypothetical protein